MKRSLSLRREHLAELSTADLSGVAGGASGHASCECPSNTWYCITGTAICGDSKILCA